MKKSAKLKEKLKVECRNARQLANDLRYKCGVIDDLNRIVNTFANNENDKRSIQLAEELAEHIRYAHAIATELTATEVW